MVTQALKRTPLHAKHAEAGATLVPFAQWEMPIEYQSITAEHAATRSGCGLFDVSHMGEILTRGPEAEDLLQRLLSNDVGKLEIGDAQYALLCNSGGGVLDDLFTYRLGSDEFLTVTNAANHERDFAWFAEHAAGLDAETIDVADEWAMLAVQGPHSRAIVADLTPDELPPRMQAREVELDGMPALVCGTGYTGEDGVEILISSQQASKLWTLLTDRGATPAGLGARDTLRLEVCFHLYGNDLSEDRNPIEAGLGWCCKEETGFIGAEAVSRARIAGTSERLAPFVMHGRAIARPGSTVEGGGVVTSGSFSPSLRRGIGLAYLPSQAADPGQTIGIDVRGRTREAVVAAKPLYEGAE